MKRTIFLCLFFCTAAAPPRFTARVEPDSVGLADTFALVYKVEQDVGQRVFFPELKGGEVEVFKVGGIDTLQRRGRALILQRRMILQPFRVGRLNLGRAEALYVDKNTVDTLRTDSLWVRVGGFEIDTAKQTIFDIKPQRDLPVRFGEFSGYLFYSLLGLALCVGLFWLLRRLAQRYHWRNPFRPAPPLPPYERAVRDLAALRDKRLAAGPYWVELTDILRRYAGATYGFSAMEMTAFEVSRALERTDAPHGVVMPVQEVLRRGDLVKFAQDEPALGVAAEAWEAVRAWVEATKPVTEDEQADH